MSTNIVDEWLETGSVGAGGGLRAVFNSLGEVREKLGSTCITELLQSMAFRGDCVYNELCARGGLQSLEEKIRNIEKELRDLILSGAKEEVILGKAREFFPEEYYTDLVTGEALDVLLYEFWRRVQAVIAKTEIE